MHKGTTVLVNTEHPQGFEKALRKFKKKVAGTGVLQELRDRQSYETPSETRKKKKKAAKKRTERAIAKEQLPKKLY